MDLIILFLGLLLFHWVTTPCSRWNPHLQKAQLPIPLGPAMRVRHGVHATPLHPGTECQETQQPTTTAAAQGHVAAQAQEPAQAQSPEAAAAQAQEPVAPQAPRSL
jgi:hypothetical protein